MLLVLRNPKQQAASAASARWELELLPYEALFAWVLLPWERWAEGSAQDRGR